MNFCRNMLISFYFNIAYYWYINMQYWNSPCSLLIFMKGSKSRSSRQQSFVPQHARVSVEICWKICWHRFMYGLTSGWLCLLLWFIIEWARSKLLQNFSFFSRSFGFSYNDSYFDMPGWLIWWSFVILSISSLLLYKFV